MKRCPRCRRDADEFAGAAVEGIGEPDERLLHDGIGRVFGGTVGPLIAVELTFTDEVDAVLRCPVAFLIGDVKGAVVIDADTVGRAKSIGDDLGG